MTSRTRSDESNALSVVEEKFRAVSMSTKSKSSRISWIACTTPSSETLSACSTLRGAASTSAPEAWGIRASFRVFRSEDFLLSARSAMVIAGERLRK